MNAPIGTRNEEFEKLNEERERAVEALAQSLRQPLIDQMNWYELLMSGDEHSLHGTQLESIEKINSAANRMFAQVLDLLDEEKITERSRTGKEASAVDEAASGGEAQGAASPEEEPASPAEVERPASLDIALRSADRLDFKILVVENCSIQRDLLVSVLQRKFHAFSAANGWEALNLMVERPDMILTELDLPDVNGVEMLRHARDIVQDLVAFVMYDAKDRALLAAAEAIGVQEALLKPFCVADLVGKVAGSAGRRRTQRAFSVLVVCPNVDERYALYDLLDPRYRTHTAGYAEAAMEAGEDHFDLLIIDTEGGESSWEDVVTCVHGRNRYIKVLPLSSRPDSAMAGALERLGIDSALLKPYSFDDLLLRTRDLLGIGEIDGGVLRTVYRKLA